MKKFEKILRHRGHMGASFGVGPCSRKILAAREIIICKKSPGAWPEDPGRPKWRSRGPKFDEFSETSRNFQHRCRIGRVIDRL